jgi:hypothetical protein
MLAVPAPCDLIRAIQNNYRRARDQLVTCAGWPDWWMRRHGFISSLARFSQQP